MCLRFLGRAAWPFDVLSVFSVSFFFFVLYSWSTKTFWDLSHFLPMPFHLTVLNCLFSMSNLFQDKTNIFQTNANYFTVYMCTDINPHAALCTLKTGHQNKVRSSFDWQKAISIHETCHLGSPRAYYDLTSRSPRAALTPSRRCTRVQPALCANRRRGDGWRTGGACHRRFMGWGKSGYARDGEGVARSGCRFYFPSNIFQSSLRELFKYCLTL